MGIRAFGNSSGFEVNVLRETPGPQRMSAWNPVGGTGTECGIETEVYDRTMGFEVLCSVCPLARGNMLGTGV